MKKLSLFTLLPLLFQMVFFGSGLYGVMLEGEALLCSCNHASAKEVHHNAEDSGFRRNSHLKMASQGGESMKESCHSAKKGETHLCQCKKANKKSVYLQAFLQTIYLKSAKQCIYPQFLSQFTPAWNPGETFQGYFPQQFRPPQPV